MLSAFDGVQESMNGIQTAMSERRVIDELTGRLADQFVQVDPAQVARVVSREFARFDGSPIRDFIPLFVERNAKAGLTKLTAQAQLRATA
jgi:hypothetical protein